MLFEPAVRGFSMITEYLVEHGAKVNVEGEVGLPEYTDSILETSDRIPDYICSILITYNNLVMEGCCP